MTDPKFIKAALDKFSDNLQARRALHGLAVHKSQIDASYHAYDALDIDALLNSMYRAINAIENNPVSR